MFIYLSTKRFPSTTADHIYTRFLARALAGVLGDSFRLVISGAVPTELSDIPVISVPSPRRFRRIFFFFWLPLFATSRGYRNRDSVFFSNDFYLLSALAFWKNLPFFAYRICSDWHLLSETWRDEYVAKHSDYLITTSQRLKEILVARTGVDAERVRVVYGGIDLAPYSLPVRHDRKSLGLPEGKLLVGYVGYFKTLGQDKGLTTMIKALHATSNDVHMVFVGGTEEEIYEYQQVATAEGVSDRCTWLERQSFENVVAYEKALDILVIPYPNEPHFRDYGFPMKVYEYLASGTPIIYSNLLIMKEVLLGIGTPFQPEDGDSLATAITTVRVHSNYLNPSVELKQYSWEEKAKNIATITESEL